MFGAPKMGASSRSPARAPPPSIHRNLQNAENLQSCLLEDIELGNVGVEYPRSALVCYVQLSWQKRMRARRAKSDTQQSVISWSTSQ